MTLASYTPLHLPSAGIEKGYHPSDFYVFIFFVHVEADVDLGECASDLLTYVTGQVSGYSSSAS